MVGMLVGGVVMLASSPGWLEEAASNLVADVATAYARSTVPAGNAPPGVEKGAVPAASPGLLVVAGEAVLALAVGLLTRLVIAVACCAGWSGSPSP